MVVKGGVIQNDEFYKQDLLQIAEMRLRRGRWELDPEGFVLDVGWLPDLDPNGTYKLAIVRHGNWQEPYKEVLSRSASEIRAALEHFMGKERIDMRHHR